MHFRSPDTAPAVLRGACLMSQRLSTSTVQPGAMVYGITLVPALNLAIMPASAPSIHPVILHFSEGRLEISVLIQIPKSHLSAAWASQLCMRVKEQADCVKGPLSAQVLVQTFVCQSCV